MEEESAAWFVLFISLIMLLLGVGMQIHSRVLTGKEFTSKSLLKHTKIQIKTVSNDTTFFYKIPKQ